MGDREMAFDNISRTYDRLVKSGDDLMSQCYKMVYEIFVHNFLGEYEEATTKLIKLNKTYPDFGDYGWCYSPYFDKVRKTYPPFQQALDNLKLRPVLDTQAFIKM
jgi:hypothetical protein